MSELDTATSQETAVETESLLTGKDPTDTSQQGVTAQAATEAESGNVGEAELQWEAPEAYEPFAMPEGIELDQDSFDRFTAMAKEHGMPQEIAQQYADFGAELVMKAQEGTVETLSDQWTETLSKWVDEIKTDKELGGDKLPETLSVARKAIATFGSDELVKTLEETGMTNNPALLRFAYNIGKALSDDKFHSGNASHGGSKSLGDILYPTMQ